MQITMLAMYVRRADAVGLQLIAWARAIQAGGHVVRVIAERVDPGTPDDIRAITTISDGSRLPQSQDWTALESSDLVICDYPAYFSLAECLRLLAAPRVMFSYHGVTPPALWPDPKGRAYLERSRRRAALTHFADLAVARSEFTRQELHHLTGYPLGRIAVLPCSVPPAPAPLPESSRSPDELPMILSVGRLAANKRPQMLVEALAIVRREFPMTQLVLAGDSQGPSHAPVVAEVRSRAAALGLADVVRITGMASDSELEALYRCATLLASASVHEGFCVPVVEAMSRGVPVVAVAAGALPETVGDAGLITPPDDPDALAAAMLQVLRDPSLRRTLIERGRARSQQFTPHVVGQELLRLIDDVPPRPQRKAGLPRLRQVAPIEELDSAAEVALPALVSHRLPLVRRVLWRARRWLTSDIERRLDELTQRQVAFNRQVARSLHAADEWSADASERDAARRHESRERDS